MMPKAASESAAAEGTKLIEAIQIEAECLREGEHANQHTIDLLDRSVAALCSSSRPDEEMPWRCFHCHGIFTDPVCAAAHFGNYIHSDPSCQIDIGKFRQMESDLNRWQLEDTDLHRQIHGLVTKAHVDVQRAEETGYARGLTDARAHLQLSHFTTDDETRARILAFNRDAHDWEDIEGRSFLLGHFLHLGLNAAEAEQAAQQEELF